MTAKFIFENGVMKPNPAYLAEQKSKGTPSTIPDPSKSLAVVSSQEDIMAVQELQQQKTGQAQPLAPSTQASMEIIMDPAMGFADKIKNPNVSGNDLLDGLNKFFSRYEVPIGLINKALALTEYKLNFIIDDSGSMAAATDALFEAACDYTKRTYDPDGRNAKRPMTRWQEVEDRMHTLIEMIAYVPTNGITISFLNRSTKIQLSQTTGKTPEQFMQEAHEKIHAAFAGGPGGGTPIYAKLKDAFAHSKSPTMHYLLTDGEPSDASTQQVGTLILNRANPKENPVTLMSCTNDDAQVEWMKDIEEIAPYVSELDDYEDEKAEVLKDQGPALPFTKGFWLLCQLIAAINPDDLDAMDEGKPFSKFTLDNLMGMTLTPQEYDKYFDQYPQAAKFQHMKQALMTDPRPAKQILPPDPAPGQAAPASAAGFFGAPSAPAYSSYGNPPAYRP